jgi:hypothetical protein
VAETDRHSGQGLTRTIPETGGYVSPKHALGGVFFGLGPYYDLVDSLLGGTSGHDRRFDRHRGGVRGAPTAAGRSYVVADLDRAMLNEIAGAAPLRRQRKTSTWTRSTCRSSSGRIRRLRERLAPSADRAIAASCPHSYEAHRSPETGPAFACTMPVGELHGVGPATSARFSWGFWKSLDAHFGTAGA